MSSLALYASPIEDTEPCETKKNNHNKTIKKRQNNMLPHVKALVERIHKQQEDNDDNSCLGDFKPIKPPMSMGVERKIMRDNSEDSENSENSSNTNEITNNIENKGISSYNDDIEESTDGDSALNVEGFSNLEDTYAQNYYDSMPTYNKIQNQSHSHGLNQLGTTNKDALTDKLNYMIHLLEEQKNEKTGAVHEEMVLYSFLGVFVIFIVDSFARAGKYCR